MKLKIILIVILMSVSAGCAKLVAPGSTATPISSPAPTILPTATFAPSPIDSPLPTPFESPLATPLESPLATPDFDGQDALVQEAINDLSNRLGLSIDEIAVLSVNQIELSIPDVACTADNANTLSPVIPAQAIGWEIVLTARQINYTYHAHERDMVLCAPPS